MGILINTGFDLWSGSPLDNRTLKDTIAERDALVTEGKVHENLKVYCKDTQTEYRWTGTDWEEVGSSGGTTDIDLSDIILDSEVRLDKTYSSSKIYSSIQDAIDTSKAYTLSELGKMSGASYKVVTTTNEMTDEKIIYLLDNGTTFDMYIVDNGTPTKIGDTDIDLSDYYTKTEIDTDFLKKVDADSKYATITTVDDKVNKANILTTLDGAVTDEQVASALLTKTELDKTNAKLGDKADNTELNKRREIRVDEIYHSNSYYRVDAIGYYARPLYFRVVSSNGGEEILSFCDIVAGERKVIGRSVNATFKYIPPASNASNGTLFIKANHLDTTLTIFYTQIYGVESIPTLRDSTAEEYATGMDFNVIELATMDKLGDNDTRVTTLETQVSELFQSVSSGKTLVANAITDKGVSTATNATFATMATNIGKISVSGYKQETISYNISSSDITPLTITFSANVIGVKQVIPPTYGSRIINTKTSSDMFTVNGKELTLYVSGIGKWLVTALIKA